MKVYTDGSAVPNPGPGGAGAVFVDDDEDFIKEIVYAGGEDTTNNRMEIQAVIMAFDSLPLDESVTIYTDSQYVKKGITEWITNWVKRGWLTASGARVKNMSLWKELLACTKKYPNVTVEWVKGHNGNRWNERADELASLGTDYSTQGLTGIQDVTQPDTVDNETSELLKECDQFINCLADLKKRVLAKNADTDRKRANVEKNLEKLQIYMAYLREASVDIEDS